MKFAKYLESQSVPEWRKAYISYKGLKKKLKQVERFRKYKERKAAIQLDNVFQELEDGNDSYYWPHHNPSISMRPQSIMSRLSSRFSSRHDGDDRPSSRQASFPSSTTTLSVLDQVLFHASASERHFFDALDLELDKISRFYDEKEKESRLKLDALKVQMQFIAEYGRHLVNIGVSICYFFSILKND
ncbi:SPX domain-containing protein [Mucor lusitanicus]|uniref:SPX domain-containing protein n=1 Tax=Mucor circinelloides f. lusitanicus TaxID=29924 RepID=A0A8H4EYY6_MUCCL|nr:SPX domain-containing protein [Mucor lusitanicus]